MGQITVSSAWSSLVSGKSVDANGTLQVPAATVMANLNKVAGGDFSGFSTGDKMMIDAPFVGPGEKNVSQMCRDMVNVINRDFGGQPGPAAAFFHALSTNDSIGKMNFDQLVQSGTVDKLAQMYQHNLRDFAGVKAGSYGDISALSTRVNQVVTTEVTPPAAAPAAPAVATSPPRTSPATRPAPAARAPS